MCAWLRPCIFKAAHRHRCRSWRGSWALGPARSRAGPGCPRNGQSSRGRRLVWAAGRCGGGCRWCLVDRISIIKKRYLGGGIEVRAGSQASRLWLAPRQVCAPRSQGAGMQTLVKVGTLDACCSSRRGPAVPAAAAPPATSAGACCRRRLLAAPLPAKLWNVGAVG